VGISRDITEKKHHEEELKNLNELLTNMLYMAAHDIKSPIVNMKIMLQLLQESVGDIDLYLPKLNSSVNQLENVIEGLSKLIHAQVNNDVKVSSIYVKKEVEAVLSYNQAKLNECGGVLLNNIDDELSLNYIDQYFNSILSNLISNAIKYRDNQRSLQIVVRAERYDQQVKLTLSDNGVGMDLEHIGNKLFKPFSRFNSKVKGTGIGLYLINNLIRKNGGHIEVDSTPGQGTTFICYLNEYPLTRNDSSYKDINEKISDINSQRINDQQRS
jgi:signal transduction histidine kinase